MRVLMNRSAAILSACTVILLLICGCSDGKGASDTDRGVSSGFASPEVVLPEDNFDDIEIDTDDGLIFGEDDKELSGSSADGQTDNVERTENGGALENGDGEGDRADPSPTKTDDPNVDGKNGGDAETDPSASLPGTTKPANTCSSDLPRTPDTAVPDNDPTDGTADLVDPLFDEIIGGELTQEEIVLPPDPFG